MLDLRPGQVQAAHVLAEAPEQEPLFYQDLEGQILPQAQ